MIRRIFKNLVAKSTEKVDTFLEKHHLPRGYFNANRRSVTRGILVGFFWGAIPMPMQMAGILATTPFFRFNVPISIIVVWLSNPVTYPFIFYGEYLIGNTILGRPNIEGIELTLSWFQSHWGQLATSMYLGAFVVATAVNFMVYLLINWLWMRSVKHEKHKKEALRRERKAATETDHADN